MQAYVFHVKFVTRFLIWVRSSYRILLCFLDVGACTLLIFGSGLRWLCFSCCGAEQVGRNSKARFTRCLPCPFHTHAIPLPCHATNGLECVFPIWFTQCGCVWFTLAMPRPRHALTMPFFSRPLHSTAIERWPVGYLPMFSFFRLPRRLLSEACQTSSQQSIPTTVKSGSSTLQKRRSVKLSD